MVKTKITLSVQFFHTFHTFHIFKIRNYAIEYSHLLRILDYPDHRQYMI